MSFYDTEEGVKTWTAIGRRHHLRDTMFLPTISPWFKPGTIHEVGAACGHLSKILKEMGWQISCSDFSNAFVNYMRSEGLDAERVDATRMDQEIDDRFDNILAQGLSPLSERDEDRYVTTIRALHATLKPAGRLIVIFGVKRDAYNRKHYYQPDEQVEIFKRTSLFKVVKVIPHQVLPPGLYRNWNRKVFNSLDFWLAKLICNRKVMIFEKLDP